MAFADYPKEKNGLIIERHIQMVKVKIDILPDGNKENAVPHLRDAHIFTLAKPMLCAITGALELFVNLLHIRPRLTQQQTLHILHNHDTRPEFCHGLDKHKRKVVEGLFCLAFPEFLLFAPTFLAVARH